MPRHLNALRTALFGQTPLGVVGALLQWITLSVLLTLPLVAPFSQWTLILATLGISALVAGLVCSLRGGSLGPILLIPGVVGVCLLVLLTVLSYPVRFLSPIKPGERRDD